VLPSGRYATPVGEVLRITNDPYGMAISPNGEKAVTLHNGVITIINLTSLDVQRIPSYDNKITSPLTDGSFLGVAFSSDSKRVYLSGGDKGDIVIYDIEKFNKIDSISLNGKINGEDYQDSFTSDLMLNPDKNELLVLDRGNFRMVRVDLTTRKVTASVKGTTLSHDKNCFSVGNFSFRFIPVSENIVRAVISLTPYIFVTSTPNASYKY